MQDFQRQLWRLAAAWLMAASGSLALAESPPGIESTYREHTRGVQLARAGQHDAALGVLLPLLAQFPDDYPLQRDVILITTWKGDCPDALRRFARARNRPDLEPYLVVAVSDCLLEGNRPKEARWLTRRTLERNPGDESLRHAFLKADLVLRVEHNQDEERPQLDISLHNDASDQGLAEWIGAIEGSMRVATDTRLYARYRLTRTTESQYRRGDLDRAGIGVRYRVDERLLLDQEFSADLEESGQGGSSTRLLYEPRDAWRAALAYHSWSETLPLRARAAGIEARSGSAEVGYESRDYRREWLASFTALDFSDGNRRASFYTTAGYAWEMQARREQRLYLEWYQSSNSLNDAVYFNPGHDYSLGLTHRTDFVYHTRFRRHVDHLTVSAALYAQEGFDTLPRGVLRYEQEYDFDNDHSLTAGAGVARNVYDGKYETEWRVSLYYARRF